MSVSRLPFVYHHITTRGDSRTVRLREMAEVSRLVSVDTEFISSESTNLTLIQIGVKIEGQVEVFVFDLARIGEIERTLRSLFKTEAIAKVGCGLKQDFDRLVCHGVNCVSFIDIQHIARSLGFHRYGLDEISTTLIGDRKMVVNHDTRVPVDPRLEVVYAAYDAYLVLECYLKMLAYRHPLNSIEKRLEPPVDVDLEEYWRWAYPYIRSRDGHIRVVDLLQLVLQGYSLWNLRYSRSQIVKMNEEAIHRLHFRGIIQLNNDIISIRAVGDTPPPLMKAYCGDPKPHDLQVGLIETGSRLVEPARRGLYPKRDGSSLQDEHGFPPFDGKPSQRTSSTSGKSGISRADRSSTWRSRRY